MTWRQELVTNIWSVANRLKHFEVRVRILELDVFHRSPKPSNAISIMWSYLERLAMIVDRFCPKCKRFHDEYKECKPLGK